MTSTWPVTPNAGQKSVCDWLCFMGIEQPAQLPPSVIGQHLLSISCVGILVNRQEQLWAEILTLCHVFLSFLSDLAVDLLWIKCRIIKEYRGDADRTFRCHVLEVIVLIRDWNCAGMSPSSRSVLFHCSHADGVLSCFYIFHSDCLACFLH